MQGVPGAGGRDRGGRHPSRETQATPSHPARPPRATGLCLLPCHPALTGPPPAPYPALRTQTRVFLRPFQRISCARRGAEGAAVTPANKRCPRLSKRFELLKRKPACAADAGIGATLVGIREVRLGEGRDCSGAGQLEDGSGKGGSAPGLPSRMFSREGKRLNCDSAAAHRAPGLFFWQWHARPRRCRGRSAGRAKA